MTDKKKDHDEKDHDKERHGKGHFDRPDQGLPGEEERPSAFPRPTPYGVTPMAAGTEVEDPLKKDLEKAEKGELKAELRMSSGRAENEGELTAGRKAGDVIKSLYIPDGQVLEVFDFRADMTVAGSDEKAGLELRIRGKSYSSRANEPDAEPTTLITGNTVGLKSAAIPLPPQRIAPSGDRGGIVDIIQIRDDTTGEGTVTLDGGLVSEEEAAAPKSGVKGEEEDTETKESKKKDSDKGEE